MCLQKDSTQMNSKLMLVTILCLLFMTFSVAFADPIRIMPLGDSITHGENNSITDNNYIVGYRQKLYLDLIDGGYDVDFVGGYNYPDGSGKLAQSAFDTHHEGHGGYCADNCPSYGDIYDNVYDYLSANPADVVLLHIGTNDIDAGVQNPSAVGRILDEICRYSPDITVLLARIVNRTDDVVKKTQTTAFNSAVANMVQARSEYGSTLFLVDMEHALTYPDDLDSSGVHPTQTGYEKMANVWLNALYDALPHPTRMLTVQKSGAGTVMSVPEAIECGSACSDPFPYGTVVTLTATADHGSGFSDWDGCDSVNGNTCTITMDSNRAITANFNTVTEVKLISPNGGEVIPTGSQYSITWEAPPAAVKFKLRGMGRRIGTGIFTGTSATWNVPLLLKNKTDCLVKITAYDSANRKIGYDVSDSEFTVEVASIISPNQENPCTGGAVCPITWTKSPNVPAASIDLYYSLDNGVTWNKIQQILSGDVISYNWIPPYVSEPKTKCKVKVILRDSTGKKVGKGTSDVTFTIQS